MFDQYMGVIKALGFQFVPAEWGYCGGGLMDISQFSALFSLLGCRFGGDCRTSFGLPDLRGRVMMGQGTGPGLTPREMGQTPGWYQHPFDLQHLPSHQHSITYSGGSSGAGVSVSVSTSGGKSKAPADGDYLAVPANALGAALGNAYTEPGDLATTVPVGGVFSDISGFDTNALTIQSTPPPSQYVPLMQPVQAVNYCICMEGLYPSRS